MRRVRERQAKKRAGALHPVGDAHESAARSSGAPLPASVRGPMERAFSHSFGDVRLHADAEASALTREHGARALTVGADVYFRDGVWEPESPDGARVLAHELAHVVQQRRRGAGDEASSTASAESSLEATQDPGGDRREQEMEADAAADAVMRGDAADVVAGSVMAGTPQRWPWDDDDAKGGTSAGVLGTLGSLASSAWDATTGAASAVYDNYQKSTDFKPVAAGEGSKVDWSGSKPISLPAALGAGIDWYEKSTAENNKKAEESVEKDGEKSNPQQYQAQGGEEHEKRQ